MLRLEVGDQIAVRGRLQTRVDEQDGDRRTATEIVAEEIEFLCKGDCNDADLTAEQALFNRSCMDVDLAAEIAALFWRGHLDKP